MAYGEKNSGIDGDRRLLTQNNQSCHELCTGLGAAFLDVFEAALVEPPLQSRSCVLALLVCEPLSRHHTKDIRYLPLHKTASYAFVSRVSESVFFPLDKLTKREKSRLEALF